MGRDKRTNMKTKKTKRDSGIIIAEKEREKDIRLIVPYHWQWFHLLQTTAMHSGVGPCGTITASMTLMSDDTG